MYSITIDMSDVSSYFNLSKRQIEDMTQFVLQDLAVAVAQQWKLFAVRQLRSSKTKYVSGIYVGSSGKYMSAVVLKGTLPNMVEQGADAFDMKEGFKSSQNAKQKADGGWYFTVPFRYATPGAGLNSDIFTAVLPKPVYNAIRNLESKKTSLEGVKRSGASLKSGDIPKGFEIKKTRLEIITPNKTWAAYKHKTSLFEGLTRQEKTYEKATTGSYVSFRRASDSSDPDSWIHSGIVARNLAEKVIATTNIDHITQVATDDYLKSIGL